MPELPVIDSDSHVVEPFQLWEDRMPKHLRHLVWKRERLPNGQEVLHSEGREIRVEWTTGTLSTPGAVWSDGRLDIDVDSECDHGIFDGDRRLQVMDEQGIAVSVLFPSMMLGLCDISLPELQAHYALVYNDWIAELCAADELRLKWVAILPTADLELSIAIVEEAISKGAVAVMVPPVLDRNGLSLGDPSLGPIFSRLEESGCPLVVHAVNPANACLGAGHLWRSRTQWQMGYSLQCQVAALHLIESGALDRHPGLKVGLFEGDVGWVRHWLGRLELTFRRLALVSRSLTRTPWEVFRDQCVLSGDMSDPCLADAADAAGTDRVLFASDWPHHDGTWPDPIAAVRDNRGLTADQKRSILVEGAVSFFRLDLGPLLAREQGRWALDADPARLRGLLPDGRSSVLQRGGS